MRRRDRDEDGIALMMAMMVIFVATILAVAALGLANHSLNASGLSRNRTQAVAAAEAGLDDAVYRIQQSGATPPCSVSNQLSTSPGKASYTVTINYYSTNPPSSASLLACSGGALPSTSTPLSAEIVSDAHIGAATATGRAMEALVTLTPQYGNGDAIYGNNLISLSNNATMNQQPGQDAPPADLYTNGTFTCSNNETIQGSVYAQQDIIAQNGNTCSVTGSYEAGGHVLLDGQMTVGHNVEAVGTSTDPGTISLKNVNVGGSVSGGSTVTLKSTSVGGTVTQNASLPPVPSQPFPQYTFQLSWFSGWAVYQNVDCSTINTIVSKMNTATSPTVITTSCPVTWSSTSFKLAQNLVIFSSGGFTTNQQVTVDSTTSQTRNLELIVPWGTDCSGGNGDISLSQLTQLGNGNTPDDIDTFLYTPCDITLANNQGITGQVYGDGTVTITNKWTMTMQDMPLYANIPNMTPLSYIAEYDYKREVPYT